MQTRYALAPWRHRGSAFGSFSDLQKEINNLFDGFGFNLEPRQRRSPDVGAFRPVIDVSETDKSYEIKAELPGLEEKDVELTLSDGTLTLQGEKKSEQEEKEANRYMSERTYGSFRRSFTLPENADAEKIVAAFDKGVLSVTLPKTKKSQKQAKKIAIKRA